MDSVTLVQRTKDKPAYKVIRHWDENCLEKPQKPKIKMSGSSSTVASDLVTSQTAFIKNLQQKVYFLENEVGYLRSCGVQKRVFHPCPDESGDKAIRKQAVQDNTKDLQNLKMELKRRQTTIDFLRSEKEGILKRNNENEAVYNQLKAQYLEQIMQLKKERDTCSERLVELERAAEENQQKVLHLQGCKDTLKVQIEEMEKEILEDKTMIENLLESKKEIQTLLHEANLRFEMKAVTEQQDSISFLKTEIQELHTQMAITGRAAEQEKLLRSQLTEDNESLIKRSAILEAEMAEIKAKFKEEQRCRHSLEEIHLKTCVEASQAKSDASAMKLEIGPLKQQLNKEKERNLQLATQVADERRFKNREEQRASHLQKQLEQKEEKLQTREVENTRLLRDNASLKDEAAFLKDQVKNREYEVNELKTKVQEMQISVEEFIQNSRAATRLESQRWRQLTELAHGIQTLGKEAMNANIGSS